jgi:hypothetical protein
MLELVELIYWERSVGMEHPMMLITSLLQQKMEPVQYYVCRVL